MSVLESPATTSSSVLGVDALEEVFRTWALDPAKPDVVDLGEHGNVGMVELSRQLGGSEATLAASACAQLGVPPGATIATAARELLHATIDPKGPRCRSFRAASYYLRGLIRLDADLQPATSGSSFQSYRGHPDVR